MADDYAGAIAQTLMLRVKNVAAGLTGRESSSASTPGEPKVAAIGTGQPTPRPFGIGNVDIDARAARERKSTKSESQRSGGAVKSKLITMKATPGMVEALDRVAEELHISRSALIEQGIELILAKHARSKAK